MSIDSLITYKNVSLGGELEEVATFFGLKPTGAEMARLTNTGSSSLARAMRPAQGSRPRTASHIDVLTKYVRTARAAIEEQTGSPPSPEGMRAWLYAGTVLTVSEGYVTPIDALPDPLLAREALQALTEERAKRLGKTPPPPPPRIPVQKPHNAAKNGGTGVAANT